MKFLFVTLGSIGDLLPFLAIAEALRQRGHTVVIASNAGYGALVKMAGFEFAAVWDRAQQSLDNMLAADPERAWAAVREEMFEPATAPTRNFIADHARSGPCTVLASWSAFGARSAHDELGIPLYTAYLSPWAVGADGNHRPDSSRHRNIGLFPDWFADPAGIRQTGFVTWDDALVPALPAELEAFLQQGSAPIIFTPGSFMRHAEKFFQESLVACLELNQRAVFLTPYREQIPANLPASVRYFNYVALQRLAPRCAALVHHGGIGTAARGLRAGIPQLVTPLFFDQPDNAARLAALGVGASVSPNAYGRDAVATALCALLGSASVKRACSHVRALFNNESALGLTCDTVEAVT